MKSVLPLLFFLVSLSHSAPMKECEECGCPALLRNEEKSVCRHLVNLRDQVELVSAEVERRTRHIVRLSDLEERLAMHEAHFERHLKEEAPHTSPPSEAESADMLVERVAMLEAEFRRHLAREETATEAALFGSGSADMLMEDGLKEAQQEIRLLKERLDAQEALYKNLQKEYTKKNDILPDPQPFVSKVEDNMLGDSNTDDGLAQNVSHLLMKVEKVANMASEVQEELKSERRVRRHLEEDLNATRHDVRLLNDKFEAHSLLEQGTNLTRFENLHRPDKNETSDTRESDVDSFEEELQSLRYNLTDLRENSTAAMRTLEARVAELANTSEWMREDIQNIQGAQAQLGERLSRSEIRNLTSAVLEHRVSLIHEDLTNVEHRVDSLETSTKHKLKDVDSKIRNATNFWNASLSAIAEQLTRTERMEQIVNDASYEECSSVPISPDPHLLIFVDLDSRGRRVLGFGCRPPGAYVLSQDGNTMTCVGSQWVGRMPVCRKLPEEEDIEALEVPPSDPCVNSFGPVADPSDCASYFECGGSGTTRAMRCPAGLRFDPGSRSCVPAQWVRCQTAAPELVPPILVDPFTVDKPYSGMGTGPRGELVVHPRTSLVLHCLYPHTPVWRFRKIQEGNEEVFEDLNSVSLGPNRHSISIPGASSEDSGVYECVTPRGRANRVTVLVKSVVCPPLPSAFYRPHPEGESRILSTLAEFPCGNGSTATAMCTADGTWFSAKECLPAPPEEDSFPCPPLAAGPSLLLSRNSRTVLFRCAPGSRLVGVAFTRCQEDGQWTHGQLPTCHPFAHH